jgi:hypothetical protein
MQKNSPVFTHEAYLIQLRHAAASAKAKALHWTKVQETFEMYIKEVEKFKAFTDNLKTILVPIPMIQPPPVPIPVAVVTQAPKVETPVSTPDVSEVESGEEDPAPKKTVSIVSDHIVNNPAKYPVYPYAEHHYQRVREEEKKEEGKKTFNWYLREKSNPAVLKRGQTKAYNSWNAVVRASRQIYYGDPWKVNENKGKFVMHFVDTTSGKSTGYLIH